MATDKNFFARAFNALVTDRERQARRYVAQFERDYAKLNGKLTKR